MSPAIACWIGAAAAHPQLTISSNRRGPASAAAPQHLQHFATPSTNRSWTPAGRQRRRRGAAPAVQAAGSNDSAAASSDDLAVVIVDHGSKRSASNDALLEFVDLYRRLTGRAIVEPAHMELAEPTIEQAVAACAARGARRVVVAPYFLSRGRHIQEDIPALVAQAQRAHPGVRCVVAAPLGGDPLMAQLLDARVAQALEAGAGDQARAGDEASPASLGRAPGREAG